MHRCLDGSSSLVGVSVPVSEDKPSGYSVEETHFAKNVKIVREQRGMSQEQLAELMREAGLPYVSQSTVSRIEKLTRPVRMMEAQALSTVFDVPVSQLISPTELAFEMAVTHEHVSNLRKAKAELDSASANYKRTSEIVWYWLKRLEDAAAEAQVDDETWQQVYGYRHDVERLERS